MCAEKQSEMEQDTPPQKVKEGVRGAIEMGSVHRNKVKVEGARGVIDIGSCRGLAHRALPGAGSQWRRAGVA